MNGDLQRQVFLGVAGHSGRAQLARSVGLWALVLGLLGCSRSPEVVLYCAQDQVYAEPIVAEFSRQTGVRVLPVFDSEAVKTVGLANRLLAERSHPVADVFWGNEEFQARRLAAAGVFRETNGWTSFGGRSRRLVTSAGAAGWVRRLCDDADFAGLTNAELRGRVSLAFPMFGSTSTQFQGLRAFWGESRWREWCRGLAANRPFLEEGNSHVIQRVQRGEAWIGVTDSDDIEASRREGVTVVASPPLWVLPNTAAVVRGAPHSREAELLFQYLQSDAVVRELRRAGALEAPEVRAAFPQPDWGMMLRDHDVAVRQLEEAFHR